MICDKCKNRIQPGSDENWQWFTISEIEVTLCGVCAKAILEFLALDEDE